MIEYWKPEPGKYQKPWTFFKDMHTHGKLKTPFEFIYIEAPLEEALRLFKERFDCDPEDESCGCCGTDFHVEDFDTLDEATHLGRNIGEVTKEGWERPFLPSRPIKTLAQHREDPKVLIIFKKL